MSERSRNIAVGITVIVALALLGGLILIFAGMPSLFKGGYEIRILLDSTYELAAGDPVYLTGIRVGAITHIGFADPQSPGTDILIVAKINRDVRLPGNVKPVVYTRGFIGKGYLQLNPEGPYLVDRQGHLVRFLPTSETVVLRGEGRGSGMIPDDFRAAIRNVADLAANLNRLVGPAQPGTQPATDSATQPCVDISLAGTVMRLNRALDSITAVTGNPENQQNVRLTLSHLAQAAEQAAAAMASLQEFAVQARQTATTSSQRIDELMLRLIEDAERLSELMATVNRTALQLEGGQGTAGRMLKDPQLYNNLVDATAQLNRLVAQMQLLVESWAKEGVEVKLR
jgi:phospholipid/cholesterol/gamma-HCH transport system substrate-binding protein